MNGLSLPRQKLLNGTLFLTICAPCGIRLQTTTTTYRRQWPSPSYPLRPTRQFSSQAWLRNKQEDGKPPSLDTAVASSSSSSSRTQQIPPTDPHVHRVPDEELPSHRERQRWDFSKRFNVMMDELMKHLAEAGQRINNYTGTDYSGIQALRREIKEQGMTCPHERMLLRYSFPFSLFLLA
jgi:sensitive to high expression protein 9